MKEKEEDLSFTSTLNFFFVGDWFFLVERKEQNSLVSLSFKWWIRSARECSFGKWFLLKEMFSVMQQLWQMWSQELTSTLSNSLLNPENTNLSFLVFILSVLVRNIDDYFICESNTVSCVELDNLFCFWFCFWLLIDLFVCSPQRLVRVNVAANILILTLSVNVRQRSESSNKNQHIQHIFISYQKQKMFSSNSNWSVRVFVNLSQFQ